MATAKRTTNKKNKKTQVGLSESLATREAQRLGRKLKFTIADKKHDAAEIITQIQAVFQTNDDDKDRSDGISETYSRPGGQILAQNFSWGKGLVFRDGAVDYGQPFDIKRHGIVAADVGTITYTWLMDTDDKWNVGITIYITLANANVYSVGYNYLNIKKNAKLGSIPLGW